MRGKLGLFFGVSAPTGIYTGKIVGSVRCVYATGRAQALAIGHRNLPPSPVASDDADLMEASQLVARPPACRQR